MGLNVLQSGGILMSLDEQLGFKHSRPKQVLIVIFSMLLIGVTVWAVIRNGVSASTWPLLIVVLLILSVGAWGFIQFGKDRP